MLNWISVMLVDVDPVLRHIVKCFLRECWGAQAAVVGAADGGADAATMARNVQPNVVLIDLSLSDPPGLEVLAQLRRALPTAGIIALGRLDVAGYRHAAEQAGADEFVVKAGVADQLMPALYRVVRTLRRGGGAQRKAAARLIPQMPPPWATVPVPAAATETATPRRG